MNWSPATSSQLRNVDLLRTLHQLSEWRSQYRWCSKYHCFQSRHHLSAHRLWQHHQRRLPMSSPYPFATVMELVSVAEPVPDLTASPSSLIVKSAARSAALMVVVPATTSLMSVQITFCVQSTKIDLTVWKTWARLRAQPRKYTVYGCANSATKQRVGSLGYGADRLHARPEVRSRETQPSEIRK